MIAPRGLRERASRLVASTVAVVGFAATTHAAEPVRVEVPSLARAEAGVVQLPGYWYSAATTGRAAAMLLLHGCGGPYGSGSTAQRLSIRMREYARALNDEGVHVLVTDSFSPRGEREICTQRAGARRVTLQDRRSDALGALQWLASQPQVDAARIGLLGWSHGGSTVLAAVNARAPEVASAGAKPAFAVAFYPGCSSDSRLAWQPNTPLLMLLGESDDWTPAASCEALAARAGEPRPQVQTYAGAHHGFDAAAAVRHLADIPGGANPGQGVHVGGNPAAREASRAALLNFVRQSIGARQ